jgi:hypothetical protein
VNRPAWITRPNTGYPETQYIAAAGEGKTTEEAQYKARAELLYKFGMNLTDESVIADIYRQTDNNGNVSFSNTITSDRKISVSAEGILAGCEIKETWKNTNGTECYALAVMEKVKTISMYNDIIVRLSQSITETINIPDKNTLDGYARYRSAAVMAKDVDSCVNVLRFAGGSASIPAGLKSEKEYLIEANNIIKTIPVRVTVVRGSEFDKAGRIRAAFAQAIGNVGFRTGDNSSPYSLEVTLSLSEVQLANQQNIFVRYEISANLMDIKSKQGLLPVYSINGREGHITLSEAENRAIAAAERRINEEYRNLLEENLLRLR